MATSERITRLVLQDPLQVKIVKLELSPDEAQLLADLLASVGGVGPRRKHADAVSKALRDVEVKHETSPFYNTELCCMTDFFGERSGKFSRYCIVNLEEPERPKPAAVPPLDASAIDCGDENCPYCVLYRRS